MFRRFVGALDARGQAGPELRIPMGLGIKGKRFFLAAVVVDSKAPNGLAAVSQEYGVSIP